MTDPRDLHHWLGEIRMFASSRIPDGWLACDGKLLPIESYQELFRLMGNAFGGDGRETFGVPDFRGRVPVDAGDQHPFGSAGGVEKVQLKSDELPEHSHVLKGTNDPAVHESVEGSFPAYLAEGEGTVGAYAPFQEELPRSIDPSSISQAGGSEAHENMAPFTCLNFALCIAGTWPTSDYPDPPPPPPIDEIYVGEVRMWALASFAPHGWMQCNGDRLPKNQYRGLYEIIGGKFGEDASHFQLPKITGRVPIGAGAGPGLTARAVGDQGGAAEVKLTEAQMTTHTHGLRASGDTATSRGPEDLIFATASGVRYYGHREGYARNLPEGVLGPAGGGAAHDNLQPYMPVTYLIATQGWAP